MGDILSSISVLLVFLTFLLNGLQQEADGILDIPKPGNDQETKTKKINHRIINFFWFKSLPVSLIFAAIFYVLLPKMIITINESSFNLWNFDILNTIFCFIELGILGLAVFAINKSIQILKKYYEKIN